MEREQVVFVAKLVAYLLIITGITILFTAIMYLVTLSGDWLSYVGVIVGALMLGIGVALRNMIKKLKLDIK
jgi:divalent metal cation (Fe/Co/Zn/Cd) transporter